MANITTLKHGIAFVTSVLKNSTYYESLGPVQQRTILQIAKNFRGKDVEQRTILLAQEVQRTPIKKEIFKGNYQVIGEKITDTFRDIVQEGKLPLERCLEFGYFGASMLEASTWKASVPLNGNKNIIGLAVRSIFSEEEIEQSPSLNQFCDMDKKEETEIVVRPTTSNESRFTSTTTNDFRNGAVLTVNKQGEYEEVDPAIVCSTGGPSEQEKAMEGQTLIPLFKVQELTLDFLNEDLASEKISHEEYVLAVGRVFAKDVPSFHKEYSGTYSGPEQIAKKMHTNVVVWAKKASIQQSFSEIVEALNAERSSERSEKISLDELEDKVNPDEVAKAVDSMFRNNNLDKVVSKFTMTAATKEVKESIAKVEEIALRANSASKTTEANDDNKKPQQSSMQEKVAAGKNTAGANTDGLGSVR